MANGQNWNEQLKEESLTCKRPIGTSGLGNWGFNVCPLTAQLCGLADFLLLYLQMGLW